MSSPSAGKEKKPDDLSSLSARKEKKPDDLSSLSVRKEKKPDDLLQYVNGNFQCDDPNVPDLKNGHMMYWIFRYKRDINAITDFIIASPLHKHNSANALRMSLRRLLQNVNNKRKRLTHEWDSLITLLQAPFKFPQKRIIKPKQPAVDPDNQDAEFASSELVDHTGGCHCGAVRFRVKALEHLTVHECNCSICKKKQNAHFIVPKADFHLLQGADNLTVYTFNTKQAKHTFCKICGVQSFYTPRSNPDGYGVMPHCLDPGTVKAVRIQKFDGENWEQFIQKSDISKYSKPASE